MIPYYEEHCAECGYSAGGHIIQDQCKSFKINPVEHDKWAKIYDLKAQLAALQPPMGTYTNWSH